MSLLTIRMVLIQKTFFHVQRDRKTNALRGCDMKAENGSKSSAMQTLII